MADLYNYVVSTGTIKPDTATIQANVTQEYLTAFGTDLVIDPETPEGVLITEETLSRTAVVDNNVAVGNQINPNLAGGIWLDAIGQLTGIQRISEAYTIVPLNMTGVPGTVVPETVVVADVNGVQYSPVDQIILAVDGTGTINVQALIPGSITAPAGTITTIVTGVLGLETVNNSEPQSVIGAPTQSDAAFRLYRNQTLAIQGTSLGVAITSGLYATPGVQSLSYRENTAATTQVIDGVSMVSHSIYVCVNGGANLDIANTLLRTKSGGCAYNNAIVSTQTGTTSAPAGMTGSIISGQNTITGLDDTANFYPGQTVTGEGIPAGTTVATIVSSNNITISKNATLTSTLEFTFGNFLIITALTSTASIAVGQSISGTGIQPGTVVTAINTSTEITMSLPPTSVGTITVTFYGGIPESVQITVPYSGQVMTILFDRPAPIPILVQVSIKGSSAIQDPIPIVRQAILDYFAGLIPGEPGIGVGSSVSCFELAGAINLEAPGLFVTSVQITLASAPSSFSTDTINLTISQIATITSGSITVNLV